MTTQPKYGDYLTYRGRSFRFFEMYEGDEWPQSRCVAEPCDPNWHKFDEPDNEQYLYTQYGDYYLLYLDECEVTPACEARTFVGEGI